MRRLLACALLLAAPAAARAAALPDWTPFFLAVQRMDSSPVSTEANAAGTTCGSACDLSCTGTRDTTAGQFVEGAASLSVASGSSQSCGALNVGNIPIQDGFDMPVTWGCWVRPTVDESFAVFDGSVGSTHGYYAQREHGRCSTTVTTVCTIDADCPVLQTCVANPRWSCDFGSGSPNISFPPNPVLLPGTSAAPLNTFGHLVCRADGVAASNNLSITVNGTVEATATGMSTAARHGTGAFFLGTFAGFAGFADAQLDECFVYNGALNDPAICRICSCGIDGTRCTRTGTSYTSTGDNAARCGSCTLPVDASLAAPDNGLGTTTTSTSTSSTTSTSGVTTSTSTTIPTAPSTDWRGLMVAVWPFENSTNATQVNDGGTCGASCNLLQAAGNSTGTVKDTTGGEFIQGTASASFAGADGTCNGGTHIGLPCQDSTTSTATGCPVAGTCSATTTYLEITTPTALNIATDLSAGCWVRPGTGWETGGAGGEANNHQYAIWHYNRTTNLGYALGLHGNHTVFAKVNDSEVMQPTVLTTNTFHAIGFTWDSTAKRLTTYVDATHHFAQAPLALSTVSTPFRVGKGMDMDVGADSSFSDPAHEFFTALKGQLDECWVYAGTATDAGMCKVCSCGVDGTGCTCGIDGVSYTSTGRNAANCGSCALPACNAASPLAPAAVATTTTTSATSTSSSSTSSTSSTSTSTTSATSTSTSTSTSSSSSTSHSTSSSSSTSTSHTTTSSSSVTSTSIPAGGEPGSHSFTDGTTTWTCKPDLTEIAAGYVTVGRCVGTGTYGPGGASLANASVAFCGSVAKRLVDVTVLPATTGAAGMLPVFDHTRRAVQALCGAGSGTNLHECTTGNATTGMVFRYLALCQ